MNRRHPHLELTFPDSPDAFSVRIQHGERLTLGRAQECGIWLDHPAVSREHAVLEYGDGGLLLQDRASKHGTRLNGVRVVAGIPAPLADGDLVHLGPVPMRVARVYERIPTAQALSGSDIIRTVVVEDRSGAPDLIKLLWELVRLGGGDDGRDAVGRAVLGQVLKVTGLERGLLVRTGWAGAERTPGEPSVEILARSGPGDAPISRTVLQAARDSGHVAHLSQEQQMRHAESIIGSGITETLCALVRMRSGEECFLYFDSRERARSVPEDVAQFVGVAASICGLVFDSIEYRKLDEMRSHFDRAASVQRKLLPSPAGEGGGLAWSIECKPAAPREEASLGATVTGDIVGVATRPDGSTLAWIGDVCGHGMGAALLMSAVQSWLHAAAGRAEDPAETVASLNEFLAAHTEPSDFASLIVVTIGTDGAVAMCDAGHGLAYRIGPGGPSMVEMPNEVGGMPVGAAAATEYRSLCFSLAPGERLVLLTDGVHEAKSASDEQFGLDRVHDALRGTGSAPEDVRQLSASVDAFSNRVRSDDLTILSIARK